MPTTFRTRKNGSKHPITPRTTRTKRTIATKMKPDARGIDYSKGYLTESEVNLMKLRLSSGKLKTNQLGIPDGGFKLSASQNQKGKEYLMNQWKTPNGKERVNSPFGYREQNALEGFEEIRLIDYYDTSNYYQNQLGMHFYVPYYRVIGKDQDFEYCVYSGEIHILG